MNNPDYGKISLWIAALVVAVLSIPHVFASEEEETYDLNYYQIRFDHRYLYID